MNGTMRGIKSILLQYGIAATLLLFILFFIGMWLDDEFFEPRHLFFKFPPTIEWEMHLSLDDPPTDAVMRYKYYEELKRYKHYEGLVNAQGVWGDMAAFFVMQLFLVTLFIKPVLPKKAKHILTDAGLFCAGYILLPAIYALLWGRHCPALFFSTVLGANFLLFRILRPAKRY